MKHYKYVIIGGGVAAGYAAQELRYNTPGAGKVACYSALHSRMTDCPASRFFYERKLARGYTVKKSQFLSRTRNPE